MRHSKNVIPFLVVLVFLVLPISVAAQESDNPVTWGSYYSNGNIQLSGDIGYGLYWYGGYEFSLQPAAEMTFFKPRIGDVAPFDFGAEVRLRAASGPDRYNMSSAVGIAAMGTAHMGFRGIQNILRFFSRRYFENADYFVKLGVGYEPSQHNDEYDATSVVSFTGLRYFLGDRLGITASYGSWGDFNMFMMGGSFKLGPKPAVE